MSIATSATSATVIGSGPNGLAAAITLARSGLRTDVFERLTQPGGACSTGELTLPGFHHDLGSSAYPLGIASPFFRSLPFALPWIHPPACAAHPLDDGTAVLLYTSLSETIANLDSVDARKYRSLLEPIADAFPALVEDLLGPIQHVPRHPLSLARFGVSALLPASSLARSRFKGARARALFAGMAAHAVLPLETLTTAAVALVLLAAGHSSGWPIVQGGGQSLTDLLVSHLRALGGKLHLNEEISTLPETDLTLADVTPTQLLRIFPQLPAAFQAQLSAFQPGPGSFKVDYALSEPIPWTAKSCLQAATVHLGGTLEEIEASERTFDTARPYVLLVQPSLFDRTRAPEGKHTAWAYCHVPNGSERDHLVALEAQIARFAPAFQEVVLARRVWPPAALERWNANLIGGDLSGGAMTPGQLLFRPTPRLYRTPHRGLFLCGSSTPPGGGVHGMCGFHAARAALSDSQTR